MTATQLARKTALTGTGLLAAFALAACGTADDDAATTPQESATQSAAASTNGDGQDDRDDTGSASPTASATSANADGSGSASRRGDDPAYAAIDAVLGQHADGIVVEMDLDDDDTTWEIDVVVGDEVKEYDVTADGQLTETDRDVDPEDAQRAKDAQVIAEQAITTALEGRDGQTVDEVDFGEDDGALRWEVSLDREDRSDGAEVTIDAQTGDVVEVDEN